VAPKLDAHSLQAAYDAPGAFDARTVAHKIIVPFDRANHRVLGGSPEPYVNNPVRVPAVTPAYREQQKVKGDWDKLVVVLDAVEEAKSDVFTEQVFEQMLFEIYKLLADVVVVYPTPNRISLDRTNYLIEQYLATGSGGARMEAVCTALFQTIGEKFGDVDLIKSTYNRQVLSHQHFIQWMTATPKGSMTSWNVSSKSGTSHRANL